MDYRHLFLGVDAGGTHTRALVADEGGNIRGAGRAGPGNWEGVGLEGTLAALRQAVGEALAMAGARPEDVTASAFGLAGLDWPSDEERLRPVVEQLGLSGPKVLVNDTFVALRAGARDPWGVVIVAGTGTTVAGRNREGKTARTLGLGYPFDDWGAAPDVAQAAFHAVARAYTGRGPATALTDRLVRLVGARDVADLLEGVSRWRYNLFPLVAEIVRATMEEAEAGDAAACQVVQRAGRELGGGAVLVIRRLGMEQETFDLVLAGGLFRSASPLLLEALVGTVREVAPGARPVRLEVPPVVGGVLLAMDAAGLEATAQIRDRLQQACALFPG
ncbi:MAG: BadF/BadG/BcrA/BcrD ATPase family protein [Anaerolineae bacterium]|nr:ATPase [Anaerolineae bacterium]MCX8067373.1 ATPase [Anaerolineae bacterium]MDW7992392.1 BadF/BadG/BcrA/BcrD ATPase family protein [Anaerolineae bacterium]